MSYGKKVIAVVGATGSQGSAVVRAILNDTEFAVRGITRDPASKKAKELNLMGAEVVQADVTNADSLTKAIEGAYGMFCVTYIDQATWDPEVEITQGVAMSQAAKRAGVHHVIWSTLEDTRLLCPLSDDRIPTLQGKYKVPHHDVKASIDQLFIEQGVPITFLVVPLFWDSFIYHGLGPKQAADGSLVLPVIVDHDIVVPGIACEDIGKCALALFKSPVKYIGQRVAIASEGLKFGEMADKMGRALGKTITPYSVDVPAFRKAANFPGAQCMANMYQFINIFSKNIDTSVRLKETHLLNPDVMTFDQWLAKNAKRIPIAE